MNKVPRSQVDIDADKEALFLAQKRQIMAELSTSSSQEEFEERLQRMRSISGCGQKLIKDEGSSSSTNPYQKNHDMLDYFTKEELSE